MDPKLLATELGVTSSLRTTRNGTTYLAEHSLRAVMVVTEPGTRIWALEGRKRWLLERSAGAGFWDLIIFNRHPTAATGTWAAWLLRAARRGARLRLTEANSR